MCQILPHTTKLIFTTTKEKGIIATLPSRDEKTEAPDSSPHYYWVVGPIFSLSSSACKVKWSEVAQSCLTLCDPMDCSLPGLSVHGIFQARVLEWVAISFSMGSSQPKDRTWVSCTAGWHFTIWATREVLRNSQFSTNSFLTRYGYRILDIMLLYITV